MSEEKPIEILKHDKTFKVLTTTHRQMKKEKEYENMGRRIYIPNRFFNLLPKEVQEYNTVEVEFNPKTLQVIYTFKSPLADPKTSPSN
jgi:hypothetical protein